MGFVRIVKRRDKKLFFGNCGNGFTVALFNNGKPPKVFELNREHFGGLQTSEVWAA
jgi:hypothetical protein